jgi:hypothetical protein
MAEFVSPYKGVEGFAPSPTALGTNTILNIIPKWNNKVKYDTPSRSVQSNPTCPSTVLSSTSSKSPLLTLAANENNDVSTPFIKEILIQQKKSADSLMITAKKLFPVSKKIYQREHAYDTSFETEAPGALPNSSGTLQGFAIILFIASYISLTIVGTIAVNMATNNLNYTLGVFFGSLVAGIFAVILIMRLG